MKLLRLLAFYINFNVFTCVQTMEQPKNLTWLKTSDKKTIAITDQEKGHSSYIIAIDRSDFPKLYTGFCKECPTKIDAKKKDIRFFQEILHKPAHYDNNETFPQKKYFKALVIAEKLCAPLLYADLLSARLPKTVIDLITEKYMDLYETSKIIKKNIHTKEQASMKNQLRRISNPSERDNIVEQFWTRTEELYTQYDQLIKIATLPQAILLTMIKKSKQSHDYMMKIVHHMPGCSAFILWNNNNQLPFVLSILPIKYDAVQTKTGLYITSLNFYV